MLDALVAGSVSLVVGRHYTHMLTEPTTKDETRAANRTHDELCLIRLRVQTSGSESEIWNTVRNFEARFQEESTEAVRRRLGAEFSVRSISYSRGSIDIWVLFVAAIPLVIKYGEIRGAIDWLVRDLSTIAQSTFGAPTSGSWSPGHALISASPGSFGLSRIITAEALLLAYLVLTHAVLFGVVLVILFRRI